MKRNTLLLLLVTLSVITAHAQMNVGSSAAPDSSAMLQVSGNTKGFLPPRMSRDTMLLIRKPAKGLIVFNTTDSTLYMRRDTGWVPLSVSGNPWSATGNSGTNSAINFIGTSDNHALSFKTNNIFRMHLDSAGGLFIGDSLTSFTNTIANTQAGLRSDWTTSLTSPDTPRIALQGQIRANLTTASGSAQIRGFNGSALVGVNNGVTSNSDIYGGYFLARRQSAAGITEGSGTLNILAGAGIEYGHTSTANSGGTTNNVYGIKLNPFYASGTITNMYGLYEGASTTGGNVTNMYDIYLAAQSLTGVTNSWGIYQANTKNNFFAGNVGIGTTTPSSRLHIVGTNPLSLIGVADGTSTSADSLLTITSGLVRKIPISTFGSGSVSSVSVTSANGLAGTVATATTTPAITLTTTVTGVVKGNGTALSAAIPGTDYAPGTAGNTTGIVKSTTGTGALTTATASDFPTLNQNTTGNAATVTTNANMTGDVTSAGNATTIAGSTVTNAKLATMATQTFKGRTTTGTGSPEDLTTTQATAMLNTFNTVKGLVPGVVSNTTNFLRADGTFAVPPGTNTATVSSVSVATANGVSGTVATATTTPAISLTLGAITPTSVAATGTVTGSNFSGSHSGASSGTNTGDETQATIKTKLGPATTTNDGYLTSTDWNTFNSKAGTTNLWSTTGNSGTSSATNFLGTTDNTSLRFRTNNIQRLLMDSLGNLAIGSSPTFTASPNQEKLLVDAGTTGSYNVISGKGNINNYLQLNIQNKNAGANASSDLVATADNGDESNNYVDLGINSSAYTAGNFGSANDAYLYAQSQNMLIGTASANKNVVFLTGGGTQSTNERMRIDGNGNVGIGTNAPSARLQVSSSADPLSLLGVQTGTSADSILTISSGIVKKLSSTNFTTAANTWSTTGNAGTTATTNFIGTTDAQDFVLKANNTERFRIVNGTSTGTGTAGDISIGDATSGTVRSAKEFVLREDGDQFGPSTLRLRNRNGENGAIFETLGANSNAYLVDLIFRTGASAASQITSNIRFETRAGNQKVTGNTSEWQFGQPDLPTLVVGAAGVGGNSSFRIGNLGVGTTSPNSTLSVAGSMTVGYRTNLSGNQTLSATDYALINTGATATWTLPAANTCAGRVYMLMNDGTGTITLSIAVTTASGITTTTLSSASGSNNMQIMSDGTNWRKIN